MKFMQPLLNYMHVTACSSRFLQKKIFCSVQFVFFIFVRVLGLPLFCSSSCIHVQAFQTIYS